MLIKSFVKVYWTYHYSVKTSAFNTVVHNCALTWVRWGGKSALHIIIDNLPSLCQKLSDLVEVC